MSWWLVLIFLWITMGLGGTSAMVIWTPTTPLGWLTLGLVGLAFLTHMCLVVANRLKEAVIIPMMHVGIVMVMYLSMVLLPEMVPGLLDSSSWLQWLLGIS